MKRRTGFTMIELIVVLCIISVLATLILRAVNGAIQAARNTEVVVDISNLRSGLSAFYGKHGIDVPSFVVLPEDAELWRSDWGTAPPITGLGNVHKNASRSLIRQIWPEFDFLHGGTTAAPGRFDINGDGDDTDVLVLNGAECMLFFMAGIQERVDSDSDGTKDAWSMTGFSVNPQTPFARGGARANQMCDFYLSRLKDIDAEMGNPDEGMLEYLDPLPGQTVPYQYLCGYGGKAARPFGLDYDPATKTNPSTVDDELIAQPKGLEDGYFLYAVGSTPTSPGTPVYDFQIVSPGPDGEFGAGGSYDGLMVPNLRRLHEQDNIATFKNGRLN